jgi:hypothetical protein
MNITDEKEARDEFKQQQEEVEKDIKSILEAVNTLKENISVELRQKIDETDPIELSNMLQGIQASSEEIISMFESFPPDTKFEKEIFDQLITDLRSWLHNLDAEERKKFLIAVTSKETIRIGEKIQIRWEQNAASPGECIALSTCFSSITFKNIQTKLNPDQAETLFFNSIVAGEQDFTIA